MSQRIGGYRAVTAKVPATVSTYAPEIGYTMQHQDPKGRFDEFDSLEIYISSLPASAELEIDLIRPGAQGRADADYLLDVQSITATGFATIMTRVGWPGARIRAVSGATLGDLVYYFTWK
jgi:hypothetical protein